jgi:hypothetical protein
MALGLTQLLTGMSTGDLPWGVKVAGATAETLPLSCTDWPENFLNLNLLEPTGPI